MKALARQGQAVTLAETFTLEELSQFVVALTHRKVDLEDWLRTDPHPWMYSDMTRTKALLAKIERIRGY